MGIGHQSRPVQAETAVPFHIVLRYMDSHYLCQKKIMGTQGFYLLHAAFQVYGAFFHHGTAGHRTRDSRQAGLLEFIHIPSGTDTAVIGGFQKFFCRQVDDKGFCLL